MKKLIEKASLIVGKKCKNESDAKKALVKFLEANDIDGMEDEDLETLIEIAESFAPEVKEEEPEEEVDEQAEAEELAAEAEEEEENNEDDEEEDGTDLDSMSRYELKQFIKENELPIKVKKSMSDDDLREEIRGFIEHSDEAEEEKEPEEEPEEVKKPAKKAAAKKEEKKPAKESKKEEKKTAKKEKKEPSARKKIMSPKTSNEDVETLKKALIKLFPEKDYEYNFIVSGVTIKYKGNNMTRGIVKIENCYQEGKDIKCIAYFNVLKGNESLMDKTGEDFQKAWDNTPMLRNITVSDVCEIVKGILKDVLSTLNRKDEKLGKNREKMEKELAKKAAPDKKAAPEKKSAPAKKAVPAAKEAPAKKSAPAKKDEKKAAAPAKKAAKKK